MTTHQKRILLHTLILIGTLWTANALFAQPQPLPQIPLSQIPQPQMEQNQPQQNATGAMSLTLTRTGPEKLEQVLRQVSGHRFVVQAPYQYVFSTDRNNITRQTLLRIEPQTNRAFLSGDRQLSEQIFHLLTAIDQPPLHGRGRQIIPYQHVHPEVLMQALDAYRTQRPIVRQVPPTEQSNPSNAIQQVQFEGGLFDAGGVDPGMFMQGGGMPGLLQSGDPAQIDVVQDFFNFRFVPELDVVIIEGDTARLRQITEMIRQLEELSRINRPRIEVVHLKHVNNVSLGAIFTQQDGMVFREIFQTVQGQVRIIPMVSPNAMLLIGWGDSMGVAKEVIEALDQPTAVEYSRLHVFRLTHIAANNARNILTGPQGAFPAPAAQSGFIARISVIPEPRSNSLIVQAAPNDLAEVQRILNEIDVPASGPTLRMRTFRANNTLAPDLAQTLTQAITGTTPDGKSPVLEMLIQGEEGQRLIRSGIMTDVQITHDVRHNLVMVRAPEASMEFIEELINILDVASPEAAIKVFQIEHGDANSLVVMLENLIPSNVEGMPGPQLPGTDQGEALIPIRFAIDIRTNTIVAAGSTGDLMVVEALLNSLDREDSLARENRVYFLNNMRAGPVAATINAFITNRLIVQRDSPGVISAYQQIESAVIVVADEESNSLIISATPRYFDEILALIEEIDRSPPQVIINVLIAEVTLTENKEWAAELGLQDPLLFGRSVPGAGSAGVPGFNFNNPGNSMGNANHMPGTVGSQMLSNFGTVGAGVGGMHFSAASNYINIMLRALHAENRVEVLSSPQVTTMNNQQAHISVGQTIPRARPGRMNAQGTVEYDIVDTEVNLELTITPTISPEGTIVMEIELVKDKIGGQVEVAGTLTSSIDTANLQTMVSAANNQTVVLGGLIFRDESTDLRKVPFLGDLPLLGKFFRREVDRTERKELLVILTPRIVQSQEDIERVRQVELARMSWSLQNVVEVHGDVGAYSVVSPRPHLGNAPVVRPPPVRMEDLQPLRAPTLPTPTLPQRH